jgi:tetratricopeptide (TPR) repeat protein
MMRVALPLGPEAVLSQLQRASRTRFWPDVIAVHLDGVAGRVGPKRAVERFEEFRLDLALPSNAAALRSMTRHWIASGDPAAARAAIAAALGAHPDEARFHAIAGLEKEMLAGSPSAGRAEFEKAIELDPGNAWALEAMGRISAEAGDVSAAVEYLDRAGRASPDDPGPGLQAARLLAGQEESAEAADARWRSLANEFPWEFEPLRQLAQRALARGDRDGALVYAKQAVRLGGRGEAWTLLAEVHDQRGESELANEARGHIRSVRRPETAVPAGGDPNAQAEVDPSR